jgi:acetyl-CoA acetyltransferase
MIYDAPCSLPGASFAHLPIYGLEDLGFVPRGEAGTFIAERNTAPGGRLPLNTNGGGLSYMHSGMYGMYALQESVRQMRGAAPPRSRRQNLGLPRCRRRYRRQQHDHYVKRGGVSR